MDGTAFIAETELFLGAHRLAVASHGKEMNQPLCIKGYRAVFNGEIYNYRVLAEKLDIPGADEIDVILEAYLKWGDCFTDRLRGMYAIAIADGNGLKLYRDPFGKKPLYYRWDGDSFSFASEIKALLSGKEKIDSAQLPHYLSYQSTISPDTFYHGIKELGAGEMLSFDGKEAEVSRFYSLLDGPITIVSETLALHEVEDALREAVQIRIPQDVPYVSLLSGGLDSSLVAAMAAKHGKLRSCCIGYEGYEKYDERPFAETVASHIGSEHRELLFGKEAFFRTIDRVAEGLDEPLADPAMLPLFYLMEKLSEEGTKVVLTGDGSDELFLGYRTYFEYADMERAKTLKYKNWLRNYFKAHFSMNKEWEWYKRIFEESPLFRSSAEVFTDLQQNRLLRRNIRDNYSLDAIARYLDEFEKSGRTAPADWYSFLDLKVLLGEVFLKKLDRMSMAHGIEARSPFLDIKVAETAFSIDPDIRMGESQKHLIKKTIYFNL